jgi:hypothetical protein
MFPFYRTDNVFPALGFNDDFSHGGNGYPESGEE